MLGQPLLVTLSLACRPALVWLINSAAATAGCYAVDGYVSALIAYAQPIELPEDDAVAGHEQQHECITAVGGGGSS